MSALAEPLASGLGEQIGSDASKQNSRHSRRCKTCKNCWDSARRRHFVLAKAVAALVLHISVGSGVFLLLEDSFVSSSRITGNDNSSLIDAVYFSTVTFTTVGYGDIAPNTALTKLFICFYIFMGIGFISYCVERAADYLLRAQVQTFHDLQDKEQALRQSTENSMDGTMPINSLSPGEGKATTSVGQSSCSSLRDRNPRLFRTLRASSLIFLTIAVGAAGFRFGCTGSDGNQPSVIDSVYFAVVTVTTVGYGDFHPQNPGEKLAFTAYILCGTIVVAFSLSVLIEVSLNLDGEQRKREIQTLMNAISKDAYSMADHDGDGKLDEDEFVIFKLQEMGVVSAEDVELARARFRQIDEDQDGNLNFNERTAHSM